MARNEETYVVEACLTWLDVHRFVHCRTQSAAVQTAWGSYLKTGTPGWPDITVFWNGTGIGVEVKTNRKGSKQSPAQIEMEKRIEEAGCTYVVVRSVDELKDFFEINGWKPR